MSQWNPTPAQNCAMKLTGRDILVSAAAGSGKTATLTKRIIRSLTEVDENGKPLGDISRMLIVTFTRAAAAELRSRISEALSKAIAEHPDNHYLYRQLVALGNAQICTIDAFYLQPVRAHFERLGLPSSFRLGDDAELMPLKEQILDRLIDQHYEAARCAASDKCEPMDALSGNDFARAMDDLLPNRDRGDTALLLIRLFEKLIAFPEGVELLRMGAERLTQQAELPFAQSDEGRVLTDVLKAELMHDQAFLREACDLLRTDARTEEKYLASFANELETIENVLSDLGASRWDLAEAHLRAYTPIDLGKLTNAGDLAFDVEPLKKRRLEIKNNLLSLVPRYFSLSEDELHEQMRHTARTQRMLYTLLSDYDRAIREEKKRRGVLDFSDTRRYLLQLLVDENGQPTDVARSLGESYDAIYIDEYQDVDTVQDVIFSIIGAGGKRFMVGDIKQSIYSFRGAEPSLFTAYRKRFPVVRSIDDEALSEDGNCVFMSDNFRCDRPVIRFTNAVCSYAFEACPNTLGYRSEDDLICAKKPPRDDYVPAPVQLVLLETPPAKEKTVDPDPKHALNPEAVWIAEEIARLIRSERRADGKRFKASDIAILVHAKSMAPDMIKALRAHGIESSFAARDNIAEHPDMTLMVNLLSVIDNPRNDVPLMGLFSTPTSPLSLADVLAARGARDGSASLYDDLCAACDNPSVEWSDQTRHSVRAFLTHLDRWRALAEALPIDRLLRKLYGEPFLAPLASSPALLALYDRARNYQNSSFCGLYQFLPYFRRLLADPEKLSAEGLQEVGDAVQILTIHKSKGLEFPAVFVCGCASRFNEDDTRATLMFDRELGTATRIYKADTAAMTETITRNVIATRIRERQTEEQMRVLYVALTRARERLYVTARLRSQALKAIDAANQPTRGDRHAILSATCYLDWILAALSSANRTERLEEVEFVIENRENYRHPRVHDTVEQPTADTEQAPASAGDDEEFYRGIIARHRDYVDPRAIVRRLPTKAAASKLRVAMLDGAYLAEEFGSDTDGQKLRTDEPTELTEAYVRHRIELMQSAQKPFDELLQEGKRATPAERGTATHLFLQHCDFARLAENGIACETERLIANGLLPRRAAELLRRDQLERFCKSELFHLVTEPGTRVWRELHFDRFVPYARLTHNDSLAKQLEDYTLYVQGSIDLLLEAPDGTLWLCDYKTDRIRATDEAGIKHQLLADHADQLCIYAEAVEGLFGRRPDHIMIYSLPLGKAVELTEHLPDHGRLS